VPAFEARVRSNRRATPTTRALVVALGGSVFDFKPGQWAGLGADPQSLKPYSIAGPPGTPRRALLEFLIREEGWGAAIAPLRRGQPIWVDGPHGRFCLPDRLTEPHALFVAGGTGIAPLRAMLHEALARPRHPRCTLLYSARAADEFAYLRELRALAGAGRIRLALTATRGAARRWRGHSTRVDRALLERVLEIEAPDTQAFVCGPEGFVADIRDALRALGVKKIRSEEQ
jgi:NAD(P)H-flavin reductase